MPPKRAATLKTRLLRLACLVTIVLSLAGVIVGGGAAWLLFNGYRASPINWQTFSQVTFAFSVTPVLLLRAMIFVMLMGLLGCLFPAIRAARLPIAQ